MDEKNAKRKIPGSPVRFERFILGLTQEDIQMKTGILQTRISKIERGTAKPTEAEKEKIAGVLGLSPSEIEWNVIDTDG